jgi:hypothetical protein
MSLVLAGFDTVIPSNKGLLVGGQQEIHLQVNYISQCDVGFSGMSVRLE